ncbi:undecaprenyldiphospho-muramoylpentapeptide beta-N-acetylglucosaminyltransferase [Clostridium tarantellae]|uniref:UDP-N-acetylglucosamine--N-acetylmuramyl-(pentapeptide) pyrophosphoryl-undecaprenol N-acetylglucosamine transferase n=1 Tax=Clostridium tarantellae TaxID=39493 RepID=A0A6I1MIV9_9CLOT|nr:undecaprenyldiphospho-muramoylpentapeptide beta-N-acetylglucosaminyltransferase [Clostridium tarantellae]MPQ42338.1 undecaprenyldiphospho-muramoylpentapeptide beta-N-acetylglucosaminyltransferase [Clostridium tarantellae]
MSKYKIIMTGGGSAGHVTPNLALVPKLLEEGFEIKYIGSKEGIEKEIITKANIPYYGISSGKLRRYFDVKNFTDPFKVLKGVYDALKILKKEKPDVIFSKGGFVTVPVVMAASMRKIPVISHESDMTPGLANKMASPFCDKLCVTFPESLKYIKENKGVLTGTPIRDELLKGNKVKANNFCNFRQNKMVLMIIGGSLGSKIINENIRSVLKDLLKDFNIIHICGKGNIDNSLKNIEGYKQFEYVSKELPDLMDLSNIVISRAGANTIFELLVLKKPNILIPLSANASRGDQVLNATSFEKCGYSKVIQEEDLTPNILLKSVQEVVKEKSKYISNMQNSNLGNGIQNILKIIKDSIKE